MQMLVHFLGRFDSPGKQEIAVKALHDLSMHPISAVSHIFFVDDTFNLPHQDCVPVFW